MGLTTTRELRWDDVGAPVLNNALGSFNVIIKQFLLSCGWSVIWEDGFKLVMRNSLDHGGSGCYVRFHDEGTVTFSMRTVNVSVYEEMTDIDTGIALAQSGVICISLDNLNNKMYHLFGDERTCYGTIIARHTDTSINNYRGAFGFGDYESELIGDPGIFSALNENPAPSSAYRYSSSILPNSNLLIYSTRDNNNEENSTALTRATHGYNTLNVTDSLYFMPTFVTQSSVMRGRMRGLFHPMYDLSPTIYPTTIDSKGYSYGILFGRINNALNGDATRAVVERIKSWDDV